MTQDRTAPAAGAGLRQALLSGDQVARDLAAVDWAATPLGPIQEWPQSLATVVRILLSSRFAMWMAWGPELTFFCNDAYRRDTLGTKYPWALGRSAREVWAEIWPDIGPRIDRVVGTGDSTWDEALQLFLERSGYVEETYHTFSYSGLTDDDGRLAGMLCVVSEDTERVIGERRMGTLRDLGSETTVTRSEVEVLAAAGRHLGAQPQDLPFTLTYLFDDDGSRARLAGATGIADGHPAAPEVIELDDRDAHWPAADLAEGAVATVDDLDVRFDDLPTGVWKEPPTRAVVVPLPQQGSERPYGFLAVGLNRYRPFDEEYRGFIGLVAGQVAAGIASARAYETERRRAESLAELDRAKTTFFTNVSHEFRTPLTLMLGPGQDALADQHAPLPPEQRRRVEVMHRNGLRLLKLVNTLLDFSRLESGRVSAHFEPVDLARYTAELASMFQPAVERAGLTLTVDTPPLPERVYVDRDMWAKIVLNLLSNALKYTFDGTITVRLTQGRDMVELAVTDTGIGIDPAEQVRLFERFHRVVGVRSRSYEGSGIGLALVAELAALHGGTATVASAPGRGSTFTVSVRPGTTHLSKDQIVAGHDAESTPAGQQAEGFLAEAMRWLSGDQRPHGRREQPAPSQPTGHDRPRVLVVDDNADMRAYVITLLADAYDVSGAADGEQALEMIREDRPDLVLTDVMMPNLDGFGLLAALRKDPATALVPVLMLSARAGDEATVEGLSAGADDYLVKPFSARELLARVRANIELDRTRRASAELERSRQLLDQAQRLAGVGSWEIDLATARITGSEEFARQVGTTVEELGSGVFGPILEKMIHPEDVPIVRSGLEAAVTGVPLDYEVRVIRRDGAVRVFHTLGELERGPDGSPARLRGSNQDVTEQRAAERALAAAAAAQEAAAREHRIADELQRSLLPTQGFSSEHLDVATYYRAGVQGTQVGGDWYDVIELGADRTALVMGDVMGRGVRAAAVMGQLRAAIRAYARLDLPPADVLEFLDGVVRDLGGDQIVTCVYAVYDPGERRLAYANAGHLPPLLVHPGGRVERLTGAAGPPLGSGPFTLAEEHIELPVGATLAVYTDGLVEHRDRDIDTGIDALAGQLSTMDEWLEDVPDTLVEAMLPDERDDIAVLLARVAAEDGQALAAVREIPSEERAVQHARGFVTDTLHGWAVPRYLVDDLVLLVSELVTNAVIHGRPPIQLRLRRTSAHVVVEVRDRASFLPRKLRPTPDDEHGRGLQLVALLADRWGTRPTPDGKAVWCVVSTTGTRH